MEVLIKEKELRLLDWIVNNPISLDLDFEDDNGTLRFDYLIEEFEQEDEDLWFSIEGTVSYSLYSNFIDVGRGPELESKSLDYYDIQIELYCNGNIVFCDKESIELIKNNIEI